MFEYSYYANYSDSDKNAQVAGYIFTGIFLLAVIIGYIKCCCPCCWDCLTCKRKSNISPGVVLWPAAVPPPPPPPPIIVHTSPPASSATPTINNQIIVGSADNGRVASCGGTHSQNFTTAAAISPRTETHPKSLKDNFSYTRFD